MEPLFALVWLPSVFAGQAAAVVPVGEKTFFRKKIEIRDKLDAETTKKIGYLSNPLLLLLSLGFFSCSPLGKKNRQIKLTDC